MSALSTPISIVSLVLLGFRLISRPFRRTGPTVVDILITEGDVPRIVFYDVLRFVIKVLSILSYCGLERSEKSVDLPAIFLRILAASESRAATAKAENRRGSEFRRCFLCFPASSCIADRLRVGAALQSLDNTRNTRALQQT